jgi:hypothetical protein
VIEKQPTGTLSPNRSDATMIAFNPQTRVMEVWAKVGE